MRRLLILLIATFAAALLAAPAHAAPHGGANNTNAKLCQKGGWQSLYTSTGASFASQDACSSYAAQGGQLLTAPPTVATLTITARLDGNCYWTVAGSGLAPFSPVPVWDYYSGFWQARDLLYADGQGNVNYTSSPHATTSYKVTGTTAGGDEIVSNIAAC